MAGGRVFVSDRDKTLRALDAADGRELWQVDFGQVHSVTPPSYADGKVYINGGYYGGSYAFDGTSGAQLWFKSLPQYDE